MRYPLTAALVALLLVAAPAVAAAPRADFVLSGPFNSAHVEVVNGVAVGVTFSVEQTRADGTATTVPVTCASALCVNRVFAWGHGVPIEVVGSVTSTPDSGAALLVATWVGHPH